MKVSYLLSSGELTEYETDKVTVHQGMDGIMVDISDVTFVLRRFDKVIILDSEN
jgi:hypothetical protein